MNVSRAFARLSSQEIDDSVSLKGVSLKHMKIPAALFRSILILCLAMASLWLLLSRAGSASLSADTIPDIKNQSTVDHSDKSDLVSNQIMYSSRFSGIESPEVEILKNDPNENALGRYPRIIRTLISAIFGWSPEGQAQFFSEACDYEKVAQIFRREKKSEAEARSLQNLLDNCNQEWNTGTNSHFLNAMKGLAYDYQIENRHHLRQVMFHLPGGIKLRGLLALKDNKPRPLIIFRNGIFSSVSDFWPERAFLIHLFEQSPFHFLLIENNSGTDHLANNSHLGFGGFDEGLQNMWLAKILKDSRQGLARRVSEIHLAGISLGGNGVLFSSIMNSGNANPFSSFTAFCPVLDLKKASEHLSKGGFSGAMVDVWASRRLAGLTLKHPELQERSWFGAFSFQSTFVPKAIDLIAKNYRFNELVTVANIPKYISLDDFWSASSFLGDGAQMQANDLGEKREATSKLLIFGTQYDPAVPWLEQAGRFSYLNRVLFREGVHCTVDVPYDWKLIGTILQSRILSQSQSGQLKYESLEFEMSEEFRNSLLGRGRIRSINFDMEKKSIKFQLEFEEQSRTKWKLASAAQSINLSADIFDGDLSWPLSSADQLMVKRWFHQNLKLKVDRGSGKNILKFSYPYWSAN